ncbi:MAG: helix-hairpin-helix domain-containing protein [Ferrovum sp.]|nr:helix-hairpin-helix domain-containing protein [Ferrovum sp.]NDU87212.1 helix-hairpin-helix domain-containing protein [Ferrovum sp.]
MVYQPFNMLTVSRGVKTCLVSMVFLVSCCALAPSAWALVDINRADEPQLRTVKGIGHTRALAILAWRTRNGAFHSASDLRRVKGFGEKTVAKVAPHLSINGQPLTPVNIPQPSAIRRR